MRETDYAREIATVNLSYEGESEIRLERLFVKGTGMEEIRLSWWKGGRLMRAPADLPEDDFLRLIELGLGGGVLSEGFRARLAQSLCR